MLAFEHALGAVAREARHSGEPLETYDTTLTLGLYDAQERRLYYGHAGDSGIVGITADGATIPVTVAHHGEDGDLVIPLRFGCDTWEIGRVQDAPGSVLLATDGVLAALRPYLLRCGDPLPDESETVYTPLALWLADPQRSPRMTRGARWRCSTAPPPSRRCVLVAPAPRVRATP